MLKIKDLASTSIDVEKKRCLDFEKFFQKNFQKHVSEAPLDGLLFVKKKTLFALIISLTRGGEKCGHGQMKAI